MLFPRAARRVVNINKRGLVETNTMANTREWPAGVLCITLPDLAEAYVVRRPTTYQVRRMMLLVLNE